MSATQRWDEWFKLTGHEESIRAWEAAKQVCTDPAELEMWASMIEVNRLGGKKDETAPAD